MTPEEQQTLEELETLYASHTVGVGRIHTLEIQLPGGPRRICNGFRDRELTLETEETVLFDGVGMAIQLPASDGSGQQTLTFAIPAAVRDVRLAVREARESGAPIPVIYRSYLFANPSMPAEPPVRMFALGVNTQGIRAQISAGYFDAINTRATRHYYDIDRYPGIEHIGD